MLTEKENERLTRVGPGTPMGELMRRYWHPIGAAADLDQNPVKHVKLLGESLVLYRDLKGGLGLIGDTCPHRSVSMLYGVPEEEADMISYLYFDAAFTQPLIELGQQDARRQHDEIVALLRS